MEINARMEKILRILIDAKGAVTIAEIHEKGKVSKRTIYYEIKNINAWLKEQGIPALLLEKGTLRINDNEENNIAKALSNQSVEYYMIPEERKIVIAFCIALSSEKIKLSKLSRMFDVSDNTVLTDVHELKTEAEANNLQLQYVHNRGYVFFGKEYYIRKYLDKKYSQIHSEKLRQYVREFINREIAEEYAQRDYWEIFKESLLIYEDTTNIDIIAKDTGRSIFALAVVYIRSKNGHGYEINEDLLSDLRRQRSYNGVCQLLIKITEYTGLRVSETEMFYLVIYFSSLQRFALRNQMKRNRKAEFFTTRLLKELESTGKVEIKNKERLAWQMLNHIEPMLFRIKYDIQIENPILKNIEKDYGEAVELTMECLKETDEKIAEKITVDEVAYLAVYIAEGVKNRDPLRVTHPKKILILCAEGVATALMMRDQLSELLSPYYEYDLNSIKNINSINLDDYILIVSTVHSDLLRDKAIHLSLNMNEHDKIKVLQKLNEEIACTKFKLKEIMDIIGNHIEKGTVDIVDLNIDLLNFINSKRP